MPCEDLHHNYVPGDDVTEEDIVHLHAVLKEAKQVSRNEGSYC